MNKKQFVWLIFNIAEFLIDVKDYLIVNS